MNKAEKIKIINEKIANKELSFGCIIELHGKKYKICGNNEYYNKFQLYDIEKNTIYGNAEYYELFQNADNWEDDEKEELIEKHGEQKGVFYSEGKTIGHPVLIGDILDYVEKNISWKKQMGILHYLNGWGYNSHKGLFKCVIGWENKRKPIEEQTEECINYIYELIK